MGTPDNPLADTPNTPDSKDTPKAPQPPADQENYTFNLGLWRIETLNDILIACAKKYMKAIEKRDEKAVWEYQSIVNTLYTEAYIYMEEETGFTEENVELNKQEVLTNVLDEKKSFSSEEEALQHLQQVRSIYLSVRTLMKKVGLDIPTEDKISEIDVFNQT